MNCLRATEVMDSVGTEKVMSPPGPGSAEPEDGSTIDTLAATAVNCCPAW